MHQPVRHRLAGRRFHKRPGTSPGSIQTPPEAQRPRLRMLRYHGEELEQCEDCSLETVREWHRREGRLWLDVVGLGDAGLLRELADEFGIHPLAMEDVAHVGQRPKLDAYHDFLLVVLYDAHLEPHISMEQVSILVGPDWVLSFQERPGDPYDPIRRRFEDRDGELRHRGSDYLAYALIDALVDGYFLVVDELSAGLDHTEASLFELDEGSPAKIRTLKRGFIDLRRQLRPLRDAILNLRGTSLQLVGDETRLFMRDVSDHIDQLLDQVELGYDIASDQMTTFLNLATHRQGNVTEVLTVIATIFLPLTFIAGVYGMNFDPSQPGNMPELGWPYAYPATLLAMGLVAGGMLVAFRRRGWIGGRRRR